MILLSNPEVDVLQSADLTTGQVGLIRPGGLQKEQTGYLNAEFRCF